MQNGFKCRLLAFFLLVFVCSTVSLIAKEDRFKPWNTENGLPQNSVVSIAQTRDGYIWLATFDGLARFDGVRFRVFRKLDTPELPTNRLVDLFVDPEGRLWILTEVANRIVVYEKGRFASFTKGKDFETTDMGKPWRLKTEMVLRNGDVEFVYQDGAFHRRPISSHKLPNVFWDEHQSIWIDLGDKYLAGVSGHLESYAKSPAMPFDGLSLIGRKSVTIGDSLWFILPYKQDVVPWTHLARLRNGEVTEFPITAHDSSVLQLDRDGNLWLGDFTIGLIRIDAKTLARADPHDFHAEAIGLKEIKVRDLFSDRDGNLWICSDRGLWLIKDPPPIRVYTAADGLPAQNIYSVLEDKRGRIWFGAWEKNLVRFEEGRFYSENFALVSALFEDRQLRLWVGNHRPWYRDGPSWRPAERDWAPVSNRVNREIDVISQDFAGNIWYGGAETGISRYDGTNVRKFTTADGLPVMAATTNFENRTGKNLGGTSARLGRADGER